MLIRDPIRAMTELKGNRWFQIASSESVFVTDREFGDIKTILPKALHLFSWHYFEDDVMSWAESNGISTDEATALVNDMFELMKSKSVEMFIKDLPLKRKHWPSDFAK